MLDENLIATLEQSLRQTRNAQNRLMARLREVENESEHLRQEIEALENSAIQTESAIDSLLVTMRAGSRILSPGKSLRIEDDFEARSGGKRSLKSTGSTKPTHTRTTSSSVSYIGGGRGIPSISSNIEPISHRFSDRTITQ